MDISRNSNSYGISQGIRIQWAISRSPYSNQMRLSHSLFFSFLVIISAINKSLLFLIQHTQIFDLLCSCAPALAFFLVSIAVGIPVKSALNPGSLRCSSQQYERVKSFKDRNNPCSSLQSIEDLFSQIARLVLI